ncbi:MAG: hypothetical protein PHQ23_17740, partial [Candidatus Wallbacteria bacterium]|nr:hypothetical protein [Candidatus Wallbacteria bacterium]
RDTKQDLEDFRGNYRKQAERNVQAQFVLMGIIKSEKIEAMKEEIETRIAAMAKNFGTSPENLTRYFQNEKHRSSMENEVKNEKALRRLIDLADITVVEKKPDETADADETSLETEVSTEN